MNLKSIAAAAFLATSLSPALADDQIIDLSSGLASFVSTAPVLLGHDDTISFVNLAPGSYNFALSLSAQFIPDLAATLNGAPVSLVTMGNFTFGGLEGGPVPETFELVLAGTAGARSLYSGELTVTAIPEPESYALMLAGLGIVGLVARRRRSS